MEERFSRMERMLGTEALCTLQKSHVAVFGVGGVGGAAVEALARGGVGTISVFDRDTVDPTNLNRQILATQETIGRPKVDVCRERVQSINPAATVHTHRVFYLPETADDYPLGQYDYIIDAVDTVTAKIELVLRAKAAGVPIISAMGAGNKLDPTAFRVADLYETSVCPLAKVMRRELKKRGVDKLKVVYSRETPLAVQNEAGDGRKIAPGSVSFVPPVMGMVLAGAVILDLIKGEMVL